MSAIRRLASAWNCAAEYDSVGGMMSIRWCGQVAISSAVGLAVPISISR